MKRIVFITSIPLSEPVVKNRLLPFLNKFNTDSNFEVYLIAPIDNHQSIEIPNVTILNPSLSFVKHRNFIKRTFNEVLDSSSLLLKAKKQKFDVYFISIPSMFLAFLAPLLLYNKKVFIDIRDLTWEYLSDQFFIQKISKYIFRFWFNRHINFFSGISVSNNSEYSYISSLIPLSGPPSLIPNGISKVQYNQIQNVKRNFNDEFIVLYVGNVGLAQHLDTLVSAAALIPDINFKIIGEGSDLLRLQKQAHLENITNLTFTGRIKWEEILSYYNEATILYAQLDPNYAGAMPSKLYEYLATGKFVIYGGLGEANDTLKNFEHNAVVPPCNVTLLVELINELKHSDSIKKISDLNRKIISDRYIRENTTSILSDRISKLFR